MRKLYTSFVLLFLIFVGQNAVAQSVFDPNDIIRNYHPDTSTITTPPYNTIVKWVRTPRTLGWNTDAYKCYYLNGLPFRIKFPKTYQPGVNDGKTYPAIVFLHGLGEYGGVYDNEYSLFHGGKRFLDKVNNGTFDGYIIVPQNTTGYFGNSQFDIIKVVIDSLIRSNKLDENRVFVNGLSAGGQGTWEFTLRFPKLVAGFLPMSGSHVSFINSVNVFKYTPLWVFQGGKDKNPDPVNTQSIVDADLAVGGNAKITIYPNGGHGIWNNAWDEPDFYPFINRQHKANPWPLFGRTEFCPGEPINIKLGLTAGFDGYEWRKDGELIAGANGNEITVTTVGVYSARIQRGTEWSPWSPAPVEIKLKTATVTPPIKVAGIMSKVLPAADGKEYVTLELPAGFASYEWQKVGNAQVIGTERTLSATLPGEYIAKVTEQYGCSSAFSDPFTVVAANGANKPDPATSLTATSVSKTSIDLNWSENPTPAYNETGFEVYRSSAPGGPYTLLQITGSNETTFTDENLNPNSDYYYVVRAVNESGAAALSNQATARTMVDNIPPTAPSDLKTTGSTLSSFSISWTAANDDVEVTKYDIYIDGVKSYTVDGDKTSFTAYNLVNRTHYTVFVKARDFAGNSSPASNQVTALVAASGFNYKTYLGTWNVLPNFNNLTPYSSGNAPLVDLTVKPRNENYGIVWEGFINIPVTGNYTFETYSDDGSMLYLDNIATPVVSNDGAHASQYREGTKYLTAGMHPIKATFFQGGGGAEMGVYWKNTAHGVTSRQKIPASYFVDNVPLGGSAPSAPTGIQATALSYNKINVTWTDNSANESGFEVFRGLSAEGPFTTVFTTGSNVTSFTDSALAPQTTYYYRVQAINQYGASGFNAADLGGLLYDYYEFTDIQTLPDFSTITPLKSGSVARPDLSVRNRDDQFAVKFYGSINIPVAGDYTFYTASDDGSELFIDGFTTDKRVVANNYLQGTTERSGNVTLTAGKHAIYVTFFERTGGQELFVRYKGPGIAKQDIPTSAFANANNSATTQALPPAPAAPGSLSATALTGGRIQLAWADNSINESAFEVYRSVSNNSNFVFLTTVPANQNGYRDSSLFAHVTYYYKVRAKNIGGTSAFSAEASAGTLNTPPAFEAIASRSVHYGTQLVINLMATDADGDAIAFTATNLPPFAALVDNGAGQATLTFNPTISDQGTYNTIQITAADAYTGSTVQPFTLIVNDNYSPAIAPVNNTSLKENATLTINLSATDQNAGDVLTWSFEGVPSFATVTTNNGAAQIALNPGFTDAGTYQVTATINDGNNGIDIKQFTITVTDASPSTKIFVNFSDGSRPVGAPWNSTDKIPYKNDVFSNLKNEDGVTTTVGMQIMSDWGLLSNGSNYLGATTNNNSGVYPDNVMITAYWTNTSKQTIKLFGLSSSHKYSFTFFGSRGGVSDNRMTNYTINGTTVSLQAAGNTQNTVAINNVTPDANGELLLDLKNGTGSVYGYLNAMVITATYDDGMPPAKPRDLAGAVTTSGVALTWTDAAYNELAYEIYRSGSAAGPFTLIKTEPANTVTYTDNTAQANSQYYYTVRATNDAGPSVNSDTVNVVTGNNNPVLPAISNVTISNAQTTTINLNATDDASDALTITATGLPLFASLTDNGNGTGTISITPSLGDVGVYNNITVTVQDDKGGSTSRTFNIVIRDKDLNVVYVNFNEAPASSAPLPWNNFNVQPSTNLAINNLVDQSGIPTTVSITLLDPFSGANSLGMNTGNNSGVYPDNVIKSTYYTNAATARRIRLSGLDASLKYNLVFFGSRVGSDNKNTEYTANGVTVTLNAANNTNNTVQINGLTPDANGEILFTVKQATGAAYGYINSLIIKGYNDDGKPLRPTTAVAKAKSRSVIDLTWQDNAQDETGYEIWRSSSANGTYELIATTGVNSTSYSNTNLTADTRYFYKVRATGAGNVKSDYSNIAAGATYRSTVYINFNVVNPAGAPWNNTNTTPVQDMEFPNLKDDNGNNTGYIMQVDRNFSGDNAFGVNTGNNSGIYPDVVISNTWWVDIGAQPARLKIKNLNQSMRYNFEFFASRSANGDRTSIYTINGKTASLNAFNNINQTVTITDIAPDENGEVLIEIAAGGASAYGYIGALLIHGYAGPQAGGGSEGGAGSSFVSMSKNSQNLLTSINAAEEQGEVLTIDNVYPNPFRSTLNLVITAKRNTGKIVLGLYDISGRQVSLQILGELSVGVHRQSITPASNLAPGMYILQVVADNKQVKTLKIIKQ